MKATSSSLRVTTVTFLSLITMASAWPRWLPEVNSLIARQDGSSSSPPSASPTSPPKTTNLNTGAQNTNTGADETGTITGKPTATGSTRGNSTSRTTFNEQDQPGSVVMITPAPLAASTNLYKVGDMVTWAWNYTDLQGPPTAIDVLISCSIASRTWTLTENMTFATRADFTWDTNNYKATPLLVEEYTLLIHDADGTMTDTPQAGYLAPFSGFTFGVYTPMPYTPLESGWRCVSCSGASTGIDKRAVSFAMALGTITVLTFTWFVTGLGVIVL